jgi:hypothetical protein
MPAWNALLAALVALWIFAPLSLAAQGSRPQNPPQDVPRSRGAPGPIVGAGLPFLVVGGGVYWLVRRKNRRKV